MLLWPQAFACTRFPEIAANTTDGCCGLLQGQLPLLAAPPQRSAAQQGAVPRWLVFDERNAPSPSRHSFYTHCPSLGTPSCFLATVAQVRVGAGPSVKPRGRGVSFNN